MASVNPYLNFNGTTEEAFKFYKSVFGGDFATFSRYQDTPGSEKLSESDRNKIMHVALPVGKGSLLMGSDTMESFGHTFTPGNNMHVALLPESKEEATELFDKLSKGGNVTMPLSDTFWGAYFGTLTDKFGVSWLVNF